MKIIRLPGIKSVIRLFRRSPKVNARAVEHIVSLSEEIGRMHPVFRRAAVLRHGKPVNGRKGREVSSILAGFWRKPEL